jgi:hypothetical protein
MPWINPYKQMVNTRTLYKFEDAFFSKKEYRHLLKKLTRKKLIAIAEYVWAKEHMNSPLPEIRFGKGIYHCGTYVSWCDGVTIELVPQQREIATLLHELVHAVGHQLHNAKFVDTYVKFLTKYTDIPKTELVNTMKEYNVDLPKKYKK